MTWSCCRAELGMGEMEGAEKGLWGGQTFLPCQCPGTALPLPCHSHCPATALPLPLSCHSHCPATALPQPQPLPCHSHLSVPSVQVSHGHCCGEVALGSLSSHCAPFGVSSPIFPLCPQVSPLALP